MRFFDAGLVANSALHGVWWNQVSAEREYFMANEERLAPFEAAGLGLTTNAPMALQEQAWLELDAETTRILRDDEGEAFMVDLMALAKPIDIGVTVGMKRVASDAGSVQRSMSGQVPVPLDKVVYDYRGTPIPVFTTGYGREWREFNTLQRANFDAVADDHSAHSLKLAKDQADYCLRGDANVSVNGFKAYGIMNHPLSKAINLGSALGGANIDLTSPATTADQIDGFISGYVGAVLDNNKLSNEKFNLYVSPEIGRNLDRSYSGSAGFKDGTIWTHLLTNRRIGKLAVTSMLTGNEFFGFVPKSQFIRPRIGMAANTQMKVRLNPRDNYQWEIAAAMGLEINGDWNQASGVFHSIDQD